MKLTTIVLFLFVLHLSCNLATKQVDKFSYKLSPFLKYQLYEDYGISSFPGKEHWYNDTVECLLSNGTIDSVYQTLAFDIKAMLLESKFIIPDRVLLSIQLSYSGCIFRNDTYAVFNDTLTNYYKDGVNVPYPTWRNFVLYPDNFRHFRGDSIQLDATLSVEQIKNIVAAFDKGCSIVFADTLRKYKHVLNPWLRAEAERRGVFK